jgi:hypothetical protein
MGKTSILLLFVGFALFSCDCNSKKSVNEKRSEAVNTNSHDSTATSAQKEASGIIPEGLKTVGNEKPEQFQIFLARFISEFRSAGNVNQYIHKQIGVHTGQNPGAICMATHSYEPEVFIHAHVPLSKIVNRMPVGDFCEGYEGEKDGIYFVEITIHEMPKFAYFSEDGEIQIHDLSPVQGIVYDKIVKVIGVWEIAHQFEIYFALIDSKWFFICQNLCDCSA